MKRSSKASTRTATRPTLAESIETNLDNINEIEDINNSSKFNVKIILLPLLFLVLVGGIYFKNNLNQKNNLEKFKAEIIPTAIKKVLNNPTTQVSINNVRESNGVYEFELALGGSNGQKYTSYITKNGKVLFTSGIKLDVLGQQTSQTTTEKKLTCSDLSKSDAPNLAAFIVSNCPYGLQMQRLFKKTIDELPEITSRLNVRYMGSIVDGKITSMHGDQEAQENLKQICIREEQKDKYWNYVSCYLLGGKSEECNGTAGIDTNLLNSCISDPNRGLKFAKEDFDLANKFNIGSSPTLLLNDKQIISESDFSGRIPNAIKEVIGCSYNNKPEAYKKELSKDTVATSFSQTVNGSTTNSAASCGN